MYRRHRRCDASRMMLAEAVSIDGGVLLAALVVLLALVALWCGLVFLGCRLARGAGRGSRGALVGWVVVAVVEVLPLVVGDSPLLLLGAAVLGVQAWFYVRGKADASAGEVP